MTCLKLQMAQQQVQVLWKETHNLALLISPPSDSQKIFTSAIQGFDTCCISHALRLNPVIYENLIEEFWLSAKLDKAGDGGRGTIVGSVQNTKIVISEKVI